MATDKRRLVRDLHSCIFAGRTVLAVIPQQSVHHRLIGWRLTFGAATGVAVTLDVVVALMWLGNDDWDRSTCVTVGTISLVALTASCLYFPESALHTPDYDPPENRIIAV